MKRIAIGLLLLCALLAAGYVFAGYWIGTQAQKQYDTLIAQATQPNVEVTGTSYERGLFNSTAVTRVVVKVPGEKQEEVFRITLVNSILHGPLASVKTPHVDRSFEPVLAVITTRLAPGREQAEIAAKLLEKVPELGSSEMVTFLKFNGTGESFLNIPSFQKKVPIDGNEELSVAWDGFRVESRFDVANTTVSGSFTAPRLEMGNTAARISSANVKGDFNTHPGIKGVTVGTLNLSCNHVEFRSNDDNSLGRIESAAIQAESGVSGDTLNGSMLSRFEKLSIDGDTYGPFTFEVEFRKLEPTAIARFQQDMKEVQNRITGKSGEEIQGIMEECYKRLVRGLLTKSPELEIKQLKMSTPRGDLGAKLKLTIADTEGAILENPMLFLNSVGINLDAEIAEPLLLYWMESVFKGDFEGQAEAENREGPEDQEGEEDGQSQESATPKDPELARKLAAEKASGIIAGLIEQKMVIRENGAIKASASYDKSNLVINGKKINLTDLLGKE